MNSFANSWTFRPTRPQTWPTGTLIPNGSKILRSATWVQLSITNKLLSDKNSLETGQHLLQDEGYRPPGGQSDQSPRAQFGRHWGQERSLCSPGGGEYFPALIQDPKMSFLLLSNIQGYFFLLWSNIWSLQVVNNRVTTHTEYKTLTPVWQKVFSL